MSFNFILNERTVFSQCSPPHPDRGCWAWAWGRIDDDSSAASASVPACLLEKVFRCDVVPSPPTNGFCNQASRGGFRFRRTVNKCHGLGFYSCYQRKLFYWGRRQETAKLEFFLLNCINRSVYLEQISSSKSKSTLSLMKVGTNGEVEILQFIIYFSGLC